MIMYVPMNFPSVAVIDIWGLRAGLAIGMTLTTIGFWLKCMMYKHSIAWAVIG
jgi:hypothetical protein